MNLEYIIHNLTRSRSNYNYPLAFAKVDDTVILLWFMDAQSCIIKLCRFLK